MTDVYLGLGSNLGDRASFLQRAMDAVAALPGTELVARSSIYETPPMGPQDQGAYLNMAMHVRSSIEPVELMHQIRKIERSLGRAEPALRRHWGPREIDIDLLLYGDQIIQTDTLTVPHPGMHTRWFVLRPLADLAPSLVHPLLCKKVSALLAEVESATPQEAKP